MGKVPFNSKRSDLLWMNPKSVIIVTDKSSPFYDPRALWPVNNALVDSILLNMQGILEPILIAKDGDSAVVVDGRQRTKAIRRANEKIVEAGGEQLKIPCILKRGTSQSLFAMGITTNVHRQAETPMDMAVKLERYLNNGGTIQDAATLFNVSEHTIRRWEKLTSLDEAEREKVFKGDLTVADAIRIADKPRKEQKDAALRPQRKPRQKGPRSKAEILKRLDLDGGNEIYKSALRWVLRMEED